ncbi:MAG: hypothetical protein IKA47_00270 [Oscillospiraceae bacterium]|nr:hypothetical protein [Oscillospiraceae bacterium]
MNELKEQKKDLRVALAAAKLKEDLGLKKEHIVFFLHQFAGMDYSDIDCQKRLIKTFLNSVFVYDDNEYEEHYNCSFCRGDAEDYRKYVPPGLG